ncbi:MAG: transposase [Natronincolaceae bacterium]
MELSRTKRLLSSTGIYHVMVRGINQQNIFVEDNDYLKYINTLKEYKKEIAFELYDYCLMGNHLHLLIKEGNEEIVSIPE